MSVHDRSGILSTIKSIDDADTAEETLQLLMVFASGFGFDRFFITQVVNPFGPDADKAMLHTDWPDDLIEQRFENGNLLHDPVVQFGLRSRFPFSWKEAYVHASRYGKTIMDGTRDYLMLDGLSFPMRRPGVPVGGVSLGGNQLSFSPKDAADLELAVMHAYSRLEKLHPHKIKTTRVSLSPQETDVLQFSALGKTAWEIAVMLGITESGVKKAMHRARQKLDAVNTTQACSTAIAMDIILP